MEPANISFLKTVNVDCEFFCQRTYWLIDEYWRIAEEPINKFTDTLASLPVCILCVNQDQSQQLCSSAVAAINRFRLKENTHTHVSKVVKRVFSPVVKKRYLWWQDMWCAVTELSWKVSVETQCHPTGSANKTHNSENNRHPLRTYNFSTALTIESVDGLGNLSYFYLYIILHYIHCILFASILALMLLSCMQTHIKGYITVTSLRRSLYWRENTFDTILFVAPWVADGEGADRKSILPGSGLTNL